MLRDPPSYFDLTSVLMKVQARPRLTMRVGRVWGPDSGSPDSAKQCKLRIPDRPPHTLLWILQTSFRAYFPTLLHSKLWHRVPANLPQELKNHLVLTVSGASDIQ